MWKLNIPPTKDALADIEVALTLKNGTKKYILNDTEKKEIEKLYKEYEKAKGVANTKLKGNKLDKSLLTILEKLYNEVQIGGRLEKFREKILLNAKTCPCCGLAVPDELDHHLPKSKYQALSIYSSNLIPYCHKCNNKKRTIDGIDPEKRFVHVYYDDITDTEQFLFADIEIIGKGLKIDLRIKKIPELTDQVYKQMDFQMKKVDLNKRLNKELNIYLSSFASFIQNDFEAGGKQAVKLNLSKCAQSLQKQFGKNHWRPVVIQALAESEQFCNGGFYQPLSIIKD